MKPKIRLHLYYYILFLIIPITIFSDVIGNVLTLTLVALYTAWANAGDGVFITISPIDLAPNGPVC